MSVSESEVSNAFTIYKSAKNRQSRRNANGEGRLIMPTSKYNNNNNKMLHDRPAPNLGMNNFDKDAGVFFIGKRRATTKHFVDKNSKSPEVDALQRTHVIDATTHAPLTTEYTISRTHKTHQPADRHNAHTSTFIHTALIHQSSLYSPDRGLWTAQAQATGTPACHIASGSSGHSPVSARTNNKNKQ